MLGENAFRHRPDFKKRVFNVSVTADQEDAMNEMRRTFQEQNGESPAIGAVIKLALAELYDRVAAGERFVP